MMEAIDLGFCSEHATSLRAMNLLLWIEPDKNRRRKNKKQLKKKHTHKKKNTLAVKVILPVKGIFLTCL